MHLGEEKPADTKRYPSTDYAQDFGFHNLAFTWQHLLSEMSTGLTWKQSKQKK